MWLSVEQRGGQYSSMKFWTVTIQELQQSSLVGLSSSVSMAGRSTLWVISVCYITMNTACSLTFGRFRHT